MRASNDSEPSEVARLVRLEGRVQGVGFRWHTRLEARSMGLNGWVRNEDDGAVTAHVQGSLVAVQELLRWLEEGPSGAQVEGLQIRDATPERLDGFHIR